MSAYDLQQYILSCYEAGNIQLSSDEINKSMLLNTEIRNIAQTVAMKTGRVMRYSKSSGYYFDHN